MRLSLTPGTSPISRIMAMTSLMWVRSRLIWHTTSSQSWKQGWHGTHLGKFPVKPRAHSSQRRPEASSLHTHAPVTRSHWAISDPRGWQSHSDQREIKGIMIWHREETGVSVLCVHYSPSHCTLGSPQWNASHSLHCRPPKPGWQWHWPLN